MCLTNILKVPLVAVALPIFKSAVIIPDVLVHNLAVPVDVIDLISPVNVAEVEPLLRKLLFNVNELMATVSFWIFVKTALVVF